MRVLIIDDCESIRELLTLWCRMTGLEAVTAADGASGLARLAEGGADLVIVDVDMPGLRGPDVCREIRAGRHQADVPVLLMSGRAPHELTALATACGATLALPKPFDWKVLEGAIDAIRILGGPGASG